jgi:hypothetical protein
MPGGMIMKLGKFVTAYEQSLIALNRETQNLQDRIGRIEGKSNLQPGGRLASRLNLYQHQLASLRSKHHGSVCWVGSVALPIFAILEKRLGNRYLGAFCRESQNHASLRFYHSDGVTEQGLVLNMTMAQLCTEPSKESVKLTVVRSVIRPGAERVDERLTLETTLSEVLTPLCAA